jgi:hypothetical protein
MSASAGMSASEIADFKAKFEEYNGIHEELKGSPFKYFNKNFSSLGIEINKATKLKPTNITTTVTKKKALNQLKPKLLGLTTEYNKIRDGITVNNANLEALKVSIEAAIAAKTVAAAAAKAAQDASTAAQALAEARQAVQTQIDALKAMIGERNHAFEQALRSNTTHVLHMVQTVIPNKVDDIKNLLQGEHISQETKAMVDDIDTDITNFKSKEGFEIISKSFKVKHETEIAGIQGQIGALTDALTGAMSGDINAMQSALASTPLPLSTTLRDFIGAAEAFIGTLDAKLKKLDDAEARVKAAIQVDKDIAVLLEDANKVVDSDKLFVNKLDEADNIVVTSPSFNTRLGTVLGNAITTLNPFGREVEQINSRFEQMNATMNASYKSSDNYLALKKTIDGLNELYKAQQSKYDALNAKYTKYKEAVATPPSTLRPSIPAPRPFPPPAAAAAAAASSSSANIEKSISPNQSPRQLPLPSLKDSTVKKNAWESRLPSLSPPRIELNEMEHMKASASPESIAVGPMEHYVFIPRNQKGTPPVAYLLEIPADAGDMSPRSVDGGEFGGGSKRKHLQTGGAPLPDVLPPNSEIRVIDTQTPGMFEFYTGLTPPDVLLHDSSEKIAIHPIIEKIRNRMPIVSPPDKTIIYNQIRPYLITKDSTNPLVIGRKAVYKVNILKLLRLLDKELDTGDKYRVAYQNLSAFMEYDGTFNILDSLFNATFNADTTQLRSKGPLPSITDVFKKREIIMKIVGWETKDKNVLFDNLFNMFLKQCKSTRKNSEFLSNINNLGSKPNLYYRFRLNWIILLAFHSLYIGKSERENVGWLIDKMHEAFLGWMSRERDIFKLMFTPADHNPKNSQTNYSDKVNGIINRDINRHSSLVSTLETIKDKLCDLEENMAMPIEDVKPDEDDDDPDYEPSDDSGSDDESGIYSDSGSEIGSESGRTSSRDSLSSSGLSYKDVVVQGGPRQGRKFLRPRLPISTDIEISKNPPVAKLNFKPSRVSSDWINHSLAAAVERPRAPKLPDIGLGSDSDSNSDSSKYRDVYGGIPGDGGVKPLISDIRRGRITQQDIQQEQEHNARWATRATRIVPHPPDRQPQFSIRKGRPFSANSSPSSISSVQASQGSNPGSYTDRGQRGPRGNQVHPSLSPIPTQLVPIKHAINPGHDIATRYAAGTGGLASLFKKPVTRDNRIGGSHKKRTRKHKKHPSISASRRPTRRRRNPPTEGHKYTRKRPRT